MNTIITKTENDIFQISLNRPEKRNALNLELMKELTQSLENLEKDLGNTKAVLITGEGKSFCAGADLNWMKAMVNYSHEENIEDSKKLFNLFYKIYSFPLPVIVAAKGHVYGGGLGLLVAADNVIAEKETKFCFSEVKLGLAPAVISSFVLSKCMTSHAQALMTSGEVFNISKAFHMGLATNQWDDEVLENILKSYQAASQEALITTKKIVLEQRSLKPQFFKDFTIDQIAKIRVSETAQKRMHSFLEGK